MKRSEKNRSFVSQDLSASLEKFLRTRLCVDEVKKRIWIVNTYLNGDFFIIGTGTEPSMTKSLGAQATMNAIKDDKMNP